jgi:BON domain-containing protein
VRKLFLIILFAGLAGALSVAQSKPPAPKASQPKPPAPQGATAQQDKQIEAAIRAKLAKSKIGQDGFTVRVQGGVAYWDGTTNIVQHKGSATRMAKTAGAKAVVNNIKVGDAAKEKAAANLDQGRRRAQVKRSDDVKRSDAR